ncbi:MAG: hypothetical protein AAB392_01300, partial [Patescibacteria group bacterium]
MIIFAFLVCILFLSVEQALAQNDGYKVLAPLPGTVNESTGKTTLEQYLPGLFNLAVGISAAFVLISLVIGGFQYLSTDAFMKKEEGKKRIENALKGLLLVAGAYLILYTVNPKLLDINLSIDPAQTPEPAGGQLGP